MDPTPFTDAATQLQEWRASHPIATFAEIDAQVEATFAPLHATLVGELSQQQGQPQIPLCPQCHCRMQSHGTRKRQVINRLGQSVPLTRPYFVCPVCQAGLFPPG